MEKLEALKKQMSASDPFKIGMKRSMLGVTQVVKELLTVVDRLEKEVALLKTPKEAGVSGKASLSDRLEASKKTNSDRKSN